MKKVLKNIFLTIAFIIVLPVGLFVKITYILFNTTQFFDFFGQLFALIPAVPGFLIRASYYKQTLKESHLDLAIGFLSFFTKPDSIVGRNVMIGGHTSLGRVKIGDRAIIANYVTILSGRYQHNFTDLDKNIVDEEDDTFVFTNIGEQVFIGDHCTIMGDIGEYTIVGASSNVIRSMPPYSVVVGNPAKVVKVRTNVDEDVLVKREKNGKYS